MFSMADATLQALARVNDPTRYTKKVGVPVFREHVIVKRDKKTGKEIKRVVVDRAKLQKIAEENNLRARDSGDLCPIVAGWHTKDEDGKPRPPDKLPPIIGYAKDFRLGEWGENNIPCILADFFIEKGKEGELNKYPRRSPEFWGNQDIFDPIALLGATTPQLDLGMVFYSREADGLIYARANDMPDIEQIGMETGKPDTAAGLGEVAGKDDADEQYMKHCYSHPHAAAFHAGKAKMYGMPTDGMEAGAADNPPATEDPGMYSRAAAGNIVLQRILAEQDRQKKELAAMKAENAKLREQNTMYSRQTVEAAVEGELKLLAREGVEFDEKVEYARLVAMPDKAQRDGHITYMRSHYRNAEEPVGVQMVPTMREPVNGQRDDGWSEVDGIEGPKHAEAAMQYMRTSEGRREVGEDYRKALKVVAEKKKAGTLR